jgi:site-specific DNA recombinase
MGNASTFILRDRIMELKSKREQAVAALDRAREQAGVATKIDPAKIDAFARLIKEKLNVRRSYIRSIVDGVEVDDDAIRIVGRRDVLQAVIADKNSDDGRVRGFVRKWRASQNKTANTYVIEITI